MMAAFFEGNLSAEETMAVLRAIKEDERLREIAEIAMAVDEELEFATRRYDLAPLPMQSLAAAAERNRCVQMCERLILERLGLSMEQDSLVLEAEQHQWLQEDGTKLYNIGRTLEQHGLTVSRLYECNIDEMEKALGRGDEVIAVIDHKELSKTANENKAHDYLFGFEPNHAVVVLGLDRAAGTITIYDPNQNQPSVSYDLELFVGAWEDSRYYMITANKKSMKQYNPQPIDVDSIELNGELTELQEAIAENAHDIWAARRIAEGWTYGPERDDKKRQTPCLVHYSELPEEEKNYDRVMAMQTLKLMLKLGYDIVKREDTDLYRLLMRQLRNKPETFRCPKCGALCMKHYIFCPKCGKDLR